MMQSVEEFMQEYFAERTRLIREHELEVNKSDVSLYTQKYIKQWRRRCKLDWLREDEAPPNLISIVKTESWVEVVASEPEDRGKRKLYCYHLTSVDGHWLIEKIFKECWCCKEYKEEIEHHCENGWEYFGLF